MQGDSISRAPGEVNSDTLDHDAPEVTKIIAQITAIAKEIFALAEYEVPTMKKM